MRRAETCEWCRHNEATFNRPMPGHMHIRLLLCDHCERLCIRQIALSLEQKEGARA